MPEAEPTTPIEIGEASPIGLFAASSCDRIDLRYRVARDIFSVPRFLNFFQQDSEQQGQQMFVCLRTLEPKKLDYHMHFGWEFSKESVTLFVSFHVGPMEKQEGEREPYAEQFMPWLGTFFEGESAHADLYAEFDYLIDVRQSRFPLPLKVSIDEIEAEIRGILASFPSRPEGIAGAEIRHGKKRMIVELTGNIRTIFATFSLQSEVSRLSSFALRLTDTRSTK